MDYAKGGQPNNVEDLTTENIAFLKPYKIIYILIGLLEITTNIIIVCVIAKHRSLQTPTYVYILNWSLLNILFVVDLMYFYCLNAPGFPALHISYELESIVQLCTIILLTCLLFNFSTKSTAFAQTINIVLSCITLPAFLICHLFELLIPFQIFYLVLHCVVFFVVAHTLIRHQFGRNKDCSDIYLFRIYIVAVYLVAWISCYATFDFVTYVYGFNKINIGILNLCVGLNNSVIALVVICMADQMFRVQFFKLFNCVKMKHVCDEKFEKLEETCDEDELFI